MKILALVASQDSTVEDVKTNGRRQMQALIGKDKEVLFCEYSTIEICTKYCIYTAFSEYQWRNYGGTVACCYASGCGNSIYFKSA